MVVTSGHPNTFLLLHVCAIMEIIQLSSGNFKLCYEGFTYTKKEETKSTIRWECSKRKSLKCNGTATTDLQVSFTFHFSIFIPRHMIVAGYYVIPSGVRLSICLSIRPPSALRFQSITWVFFHGFCSNFAYILVSGMGGLELLMGKIC